MATKGNFFKYYFKFFFLNIQVVGFLPILIDKTCTT